MLPSTLRKRKIRVALLLALRKVTNSLGAAPVSAQTLIDHYEEDTDPVRSAYESIGQATMFSFFQQNPIPEGLWKEVLDYVKEVLCLEERPSLDVPQPEDQAAIVSSLLQEALRGIKLPGKVPCPATHGNGSGDDGSGTGGGEK